MLGPERDFEAHSFSYGKPAGGLRRLLGVGLSLGNAVISLSHSGE